MSLLDHFSRWRPLVGSVWGSWTTRRCRNSMRGGMPVDEMRDKKMVLTSSSYGSRYTSGEELYRSEVGLRTAVNELNKLESVTHELKLEVRPGIVHYKFGRLAALLSSAPSLNCNDVVDVGVITSLLSSSYYHQLERERMREEERRRQEAADYRRSVSSQPSSSSSSRTGSSSSSPSADGRNDTVGDAGSRFPFSTPELELPRLFDLETLGLLGQWEEVGGNFLLRPPDHEINVPRGVIHFLGGGFCGRSTPSKLQVRLHG